MDPLPASVPLILAGSDPVNDLRGNEGQEPSSTGSTPSILVSGEGEREMGISFSPPRWVEVEPDFARPPDASTSRGGGDSAPGKQTQPGLCRGAAPWYCNILCCPLVLPYNACSLYCGPCLYSYFSGCATSCCCFLCSGGYCGCCEFCWRFRDSKFPPDGSSLGPLSPGANSAELARIGWARSDAILAALRKTPGGWTETSSLALAAAAKGKALPRHMPLFCGKIEPRDIAQGGLGDCWLMCALACLSEFPAAINKLFVTKSYAFNGCYNLRLWRQPTREWETVRIDDFFPVSADGTPLYAKPNGSELWVMVSERDGRARLVRR